ncbi:MAG TPA: tRNA (adenosine(37)-N6)-dimethylallyltransferase MiaA [Gemmatimonadaceae bacterium]|nr:tRNA (adenosine(37)-N6)-dimethylallyltransferase MiaA [Gemmatimonadaceae bacterium]
MNSTAASAEADFAPGELRIIAGPTGAGKSEVAMRLAERHGAMIISADSRQVYRGFDIGTAKPTRAERERVPHMGIDVAEPTERWNAARWAGAAAEWLSAARAAGRPALIVGGTGLWLRALVEPLADEPPMDPARRAELQDRLAALDTPELRRWVQALDPARATPRQGRTQLLRAAEVALLTGTRLSDALAAGSARPLRAARWLVIDPGPVLHERIGARLDAMFAAGWTDEVRGLMRTVPAGAPAWNACGYREIRDMVEGRMTGAAARHAVLVSTRQYAKRQRTWFRNQLGAGTSQRMVTRLDPRAPNADEVVNAWFGE